MSVATYASGTQTCTVTTEHFLSSPNVVGVYLLKLDTVNMAAGDVIEVRQYQMVLTAGTQRVVDPIATYSGAQATDALIKLVGPLVNDLTDTNAIRFSIKQTYGTGRAFPWAVVSL